MVIGGRKSGDGEMVGGVGGNERISEIGAEREWQRPGLTRIAALVKPWNKTK